MKNNNITTAGELVRVADFAPVRQPHRAVAWPWRFLSQDRAKRGRGLRARSRGAGGWGLWEDWIFAVLMAASLAAIVVI